MDFVMLAVILAAAGAVFAWSRPDRRLGERVPDHVPAEWTEEWRERRCR